MRLHFDHTNLTANMVGDEHGLTGAQIEQAGGRALDALAAFRKASEGGTYGFPHLPFQADAVKDILAYAAEVQGSYDCVCLVGIGGSALGAWALDCGIRGPHPVQGAFTSSHPRLVILDNVDPAFISAALESMNPKKTLVLVIGKSGGTAETVATFLIVRDWLTKAIGVKARQRVVTVTSPTRGDLKSLTSEEEYRTFHLPDNVGGRFSVLSPVGLLPAALIGIDIRKLHKGAAAITHDCWQPNLSQNVALRAAVLHWLMLTEKKKTIQVAFPYSSRLWGAAFWFRQLWAESLGKSHTRNGEPINAGQTPVAALGTTDQHSQLQLYIEGPIDKVFTFWAVDKYGSQFKIPRARTGLDAFDYLSGQTLAKLIDAERRSTAAALTDKQRPNCTFTIEKVDEDNLGAFLQMMEFQTAFMGELLNIDAFGQPGVELAKRYTFGLMGRPGFEEYERQFGEYEKKKLAAR